jgi:sec-independent protein translocase protein TatA
MGMPGMSEWVIILLVVIILFGGKKIPELAKGIGKGIKDFKKAMNEDDEEQKPAKELEDKKVAEKTATTTESSKA